MVCACFLLLCIDVWSFWIYLPISTYPVSMIVVGREAGQDPTESGNDYKTRKGDGGGRATGPAKKKSRRR
jgi:hypothetical protein